MPAFGVGVLGWPVGDSMVAGLAGKLVFPVYIPGAIYNALPQTTPDLVGHCCGFSQSTLQR